MPIPTFRLYSLNSLLITKSNEDTTIRKIVANAWFRPTATFLSHYVETTCHRKLADITIHHPTTHCTPSTFNHPPNARPILHIEQKFEICPDNGEYKFDFDCDATNVLAVVPTTCTALSVPFSIRYMWMWPRKPRRICWAYPSTRAKDQFHFN